MTPLLTLDQAAEQLTISTKTLLKHVKAGDIAYIPLGCGKKRVRMGFDVEDIQAFIESRRKRQCPSTSQPRARSTSMTSSSTVVDFMALAKPPTGKTR